MKHLHVYMTAQPPQSDDDDDRPKTPKEAHEDGEGSGYQK